jgi:hypothetical protein
MKKLFLILTILLCAFSTLTRAQSTDESDRINKIVDYITTDEKKILSEFMTFSEQEAKAFWPIYDDYLMTQRKVLYRIVALTFRYINESETLSDEQADAIVSEIIDIEIEKLLIIKKYTKQIRSVLPPKKMLRFLQTVPAVEFGFVLKFMSETPLVKQ